MIRMSSYILALFYQTDHAKMDERENAWAHAFSLIGESVSSAHDLLRLYTDADAHAHHRQQRERQGLA